MHSRELVELAALASAHGPALLRSGSPFLDIAGLGQYWAASKCRFDRWNRALKTHATAHDEAARGNAASGRLPAGRLQGVLEEILTSEVLTRVWAAVLNAFDQRHGSPENSPIARNVLAGHVEARHRALTLLVRGPGISSHDALSLNWLRRRAERWTDLLVGHLAVEHDVCDVAANPTVAREFAEDLRQHRGWSLEGQAWPLAMASLRSAFRQGVSAHSPNGDLNGRIAAGVLACLPPDLFDSTGILRSLWMTRISHAADDAQGLIAELFAADSAAASEPGAGFIRGPVAGGDQRRFSR